MTLAVQASIKKNDGTIYVIGGADIDAFQTNLVALYGGDEAAMAAAEDLLTDMAKTLSPMGAAVQTVQNAMPGAQMVGQPQYAPQGQPQPQYGGAAPNIAQYDVYFQSPFSDKDAVKAAGARWGKERKQWYAPQGSDLNAFARWIKP